MELISVGRQMINKSFLNSQIPGPSNSSVKQSETETLRRACGTHTFFGVGSKKKKWDAPAIARQRASSRQFSAILDIISTPQKWRGGNGVLWRILTTFCDFFSSIFWWIFSHPARVSVHAQCVLLFVESTQRFSVGSWLGLEIINSSYYGMPIDK